MDTIKEINSLMEKFKKWGILDNLSVHEKETIEQDLKHIAGTAVMEANNLTQNILPDLYNKITK